MAKTVKGYLQLKKKGSIKDSWHTYLCEYSSATNVLIVKSKDQQFVYWEKEVSRGYKPEAAHTCSRQTIVFQLTWTKLPMVMNRRARSSI